MDFAQYYSGGLAPVHIEKGRTMPIFTVTSIIDGDTFEVSPFWIWNGETGDRIRPAGYDAPELHTPEGRTAKIRLFELIYKKQVEIATAHKIDRGRLVCEVYIKNIIVADYFPQRR